MVPLAVTSKGTLQEISLIEQDLQELGIALSSGLPMDEALEAMIPGCRIAITRSVFSAALEAMNEGMSLSEAFSAHLAASFPSWARIIMMNPELTDVERGHALQARVWAFRLGAVDALLAYAAVQFAMLSLNALSMIMFVLPQMREIFLGLALDLPPMTAWLIYLTGFTVNWWFLFIPASVFLMLGLAWGLARIWRVFSGRSREQLFLLKVLGEIDPLRWPVVLGSFGHPAFLPFIGDRLQHLAKASWEREEFSGNVRKIGFPAIQSWALSVVWMFPERREIVREAAESMMVQVQMSERRRIAVVEVALLLLLGFMVGFISLSFYLPMIQLMECAS
jgi:type II secretory pathway component PulF